MRRTTAFTAPWGEAITVAFTDLPGTGVPLVFIHGLGCASTLDYAITATHLAGRRCLLVDLIGSGANAGLSSARFDYSIRAHARYLDSFLTSLGFDRVVLYGHSMGGAVVLSLASLNPGRLAGVIVAEPNLDSGGGTTSAAISRQSEVRFVSRGYAALLRLEQSHQNPWAVTLALTSPRVLHREACSLVEGVTPSWREILYGLDCPKAYIVGELNLPDPDSEVLPCHGVQVLTVAGAGHHMAWENPVGLAEEILKLAI